jgi:hypothetical protein
MYDISTIKAMNKKAEREARSHRRYPFLMTKERLEKFREDPHGSGVSFPNIGDWRPRGYTLERQLFIDISGFGGENEPAMSLHRLTQELREGMAYALVEVGQFQGYLAEFTPPKGQHKGPTPEERRLRLTQDLDRQINDYIDGFMAKGESSLVVSPGDCWACHLPLGGTVKLMTLVPDEHGKAEAVDASGNLEPMGIDHLLQHMKDKYYVGSLAERAVREWGGQPKDISDIRRAIKLYFDRRRPLLLEWIFRREGVAS